MTMRARPLPSKICPRLLVSAVSLAASLAAPLAATAAERVDEIQVTATRVPASLQTVPASVSVITGEELRARGAIDLAGALALVAGVEAPAGGDGGPAGAVPSFWGLHEFDAFLLVVDGIPWGGAFNPAIPTLNLNNVERIEVLKGAAPVTYGATSFVGVIQVIHYPAGRAADAALIGFGARGSVHASVAKALPAIDGYRQSIAIDGQKLGFSDSRESIKGGNLLYRGAGAVGDGVLRVDANLALRPTTPPSPVVREEAGLTSLTPRDANFNPSDARIDENRYQFVLGYSRATAAGVWDTSLSWAHSHIADVRGFLRPDLVDDGTENADAQRQERNVNDFYADSHFSGALSSELKLLAGVDVLYGSGRQTSSNGAYYIPLDGSGSRPATTDLHVDEVNTISDTRTFLGQYAQLQWTPDSRWTTVAGLRMNETKERKASAHLDGFDAAENLSAAARRSTSRLGGSAGASWRAWQRGADHAVLYADYRSTFKPAAIDFGPDYTPDVLNPETAQSYEAGLKGALLDGRFGWDASVFQLDFRNLVLQTTAPDGGPLLQNAGGERLRGAEIESRFRVAGDLSLAASASYHDAKFTDGVASEGGADVALAGRRLTLSPHLLGAAGFIYAARDGINAAATVRYVGRRFLDLANAAPAGGYATLDASIGYRHAGMSIALHGYNLSNRRPPVTQSEFGDSSYYLLPGRRVFVDLGFAL